MNKVIINRYDNTVRLFLIVIILNWVILNKYEYGRARTNRIIYGAMQSENVGPTVKKLLKIPNKSVNQTIVTLGAGPCVTV